MPCACSRQPPPEASESIVPRPRQLLLPCRQRQYIPPSLPCGDRCPSGQHDPPSWVGGRRHAVRPRLHPPPFVRDRRLPWPMIHLVYTCRAPVPGSGIVCNTRRCALSAGISAIRPPTRRKHAAFTVPGGGATGLQTRATWHARKLQIHAAASRLARNSANRLDTERAGLLSGLDELQLRSAKTPSATVS